jgi:hypothetical protein
VLARTKRKVAIGATVLVSALGVAGVAEAASDVYFEGTTSSAIGARHSLTNTSVRLLGGSVACTAAEELDFTQAGTAICTFAVNGVADHNYNATLRYPWCGTPVGYGASTMRCRRDY